MILFYVLAGLFLVGAASPILKRDVATGYDYKPPATSYGVPSGPLGGSLQNYQSSTFAPTIRTYDVTTVSPSPLVTHSSLQESPLAGSFPPSLLANSGFQAPIHDFQSFSSDIQTIGNAQPQNNVFGNLVLGQGETEISHHVNPELISLGFIANQGLVNNQDVSPGGPSVIIPNSDASYDIQNKFDGENVNQEEADEGDHDIEVSRHLYFFSSPEDIQAPRARINLPKAPKKQNLKVLFIKAPAVVTAPPITIPAQKQNEEKTVVYVLVKKPEQPAPIEIETPPTTPPSKPEVFFIKYNTQKEAEEAVAKIQKQREQSEVLDNSQLISSTFNQDILGHNNGDPLRSFGGSFSTVSPLGPFTTLSPLAPFSTASPLGTFSTAGPIGSFSTPSPLDISLTNTGNVFIPETSSQSPLFNSARFSYETSSQSPLFNSARFSYPSPFISNANSRSIISHENYPKNLNGYDTSNIKALSDSFGGSNNSPSEAEATDSLSKSATKIHEIRDDVTPHSTYGIPNKRGIHKFNL